MGYLCSRLALCLHEFLGHGGACLIVGQGLRSWQLHLFGGAWVGYHVDASQLTSLQHLFLDLSGPGVNLLSGVFFLMLSRMLKLSWLKLGCLCLAALSFTYALHYLIFGIHYAYGDGRNLRFVLNEQTVWVIILLICVQAYCLFWFTRELIPHFFIQPNRGYWRQLLRLVLAALLACGLHLGLMLLENQLRPDPVYSNLMQPEHVTQAIFQARLDAKNAGEELSETELATKAAAIARENQPFALEWIYLPLMGIALLVGLWQARLRLHIISFAPLHQVGRLQLAAVAMIACMFLLNALSP